MELTEYESKTYENAIGTIDKIQYQIKINSYDVISAEIALKSINKIITTYQKNQNDLMELFSN